MPRALLITPYVASAALCLGCAAWLWTRRRATPASRPYVGVLLFEAWWCLGYVGELWSTSLEAKLFWDDLQLPPVYLVALSILWFAREYRGESFRRPRLAWAALGTLPLATCAWVFTDPLHHRARAGARLVAAPPFDALLYPFTPLENLSWAYTYGLLAAAVAMLVAAALRQHPRHRGQVWVVVAGTLLPSLAASASLLGLELNGQRDTMPLWFGVSALLVTRGLRQRSFLELVPVARDLLIERLQDAVVVLDGQERVVDLNPAAQRLLGATDQALGQDAAAAVPGWAALKQRLPEGGVDELERPGGAVLEARLSLLPGPRGERRGAVLVLHDITRRREAERGLRAARDDLELRVQQRTAELSQALASLHAEVAERQAAEQASRASEKKFHALFDQTFQLAGVLSLDGMLLEANQAALDLAGLPAGELLGRPFWELPWWRHAPELQQRVRAAVLEAAGGAFVRFQTTHPARDGSLRVVDFSLKPVPGDDGRPALLLPEGRDITDLKAAEREHDRLLSELNHAQKLDSIGRLAGGVAHDFNNLLTAILGNLAWAEEQLGPGHPAQEALQEIDLAAQSAAALTRQLLAFGRKQVLSPQVLDLDEAIARVQKLLGRLLGEDVRLQVVAGGPGQVRLDPGQLEQVLVNLAVNARDAMPRGGQLTVETRPVALDEAACAGRGEWVRPGRFAEVLVRDTGVGMDAAVQARIFEPFFTTKSTGTGLGLSSVWGALRQCGGFVQVASAPGEGTTFRLLFPCADEGAAPVPRLPHAAGGSEAVVVVEDQAAVREMVVRTLRRLGYEVLAYEGGAAAWEALRARRAAVHLLLTDVVLPEESGRVLAERLVAGNPGLKVLFTSGYTEDVMLRHGIEERRVRFLPKPFTPEQLSAAVRAALDAPAA